MDDTVREDTARASLLEKYNVQAQQIDAQKCFQHWYFALTKGFVKKLESF